MYSVHACIYTCTMYVFSMLPAVDLCAGVTCSLHGSCIHHPTFNADAYCQCDDTKYTGANCQNELCSDSDVICYNGGSCQ